MVSYRAIVRVVVVRGVDVARTHSLTRCSLTHAMPTFALG